MRDALSVIIPVGTGRLQNLQNALYALQLQTLPKDKFEVIIVADGSEDETLGVAHSYPELDVRYIWTPKFQPRQDTPPRNKGARLAKYPFLVFLDSDVLLHAKALEYYMEDVAHNPLGVVAGRYDWLPPCVIGKRELEEGLESIYSYNAERDDLDVHVRVLPFPKGNPTHNVCRDMRQPMFFETTPETVYMGDGNLNCYLGMFSGNILIAVDSFWKAGGYWEELTAGIVDDGSFGLTFWVKSVVRDNKNRPILKDGKIQNDPTFSVRFDKRVYGCHQYHDRNIAFVQATTAREVDLINRRFGLEQYKEEGRMPVLPKPLFELSQDAQKAWGVDKWRKDF